MKSGYAYSVKYYYDDANRLTDEIGLYDPVAGSATDYHLEWEYDQRGRVKSTSSEDYTYTYRYDALNRVDDRTIEIVGTTNSVVAINDSYDLAGNRNRSIVSVDGAEDHTNTYWYDRLNRLRSIHQHALGWLSEVWVSPFAFSEVWVSPFRFLHSLFLGVPFAFPSFAFVGVPFVLSLRFLAFFPLCVLALSFPLRLPLCARPFAPFASCAVINVHRRRATGPAMAVASGG